MRKIKVSELSNKSELKESKMIYFKAVNSGKLSKYFNDVKVIKGVL